MPHKSTENATGLGVPHSEGNKLDGVVLRLGVPGMVKSAVAGGVIIVAGRR